MIISTLFRSQTVSLFKKQITDILFNTPKSSLFKTKMATSPKTKY